LPDFDFKASLRLKNNYPSQYIKKIFYALYDRFPIEQFKTYPVKKVHLNLKTKKYLTIDPVKHSGHATHINE